MTRRRTVRRKTRKYYGGSVKLVPHCQCSSKCKRPTRKGDVFCTYHTQHGCPIKSPISKWNPDYNPEQYNNDPAIKSSHNCFAYALDYLDSQKIKKCRENNDCSFHVPGKTKNHPEFSGKMGKSCGDVIGRTMADIPNGYLTDFTSMCEPGFSKIGVVVDEKNDLHYYRQDKNDLTGETKEQGYWSHKPGGRSVTNKDALGARIYRPDLASRFYPSEGDNDNELNYSSFCSYMCVPRKNSGEIVNPIQIAGRRYSRRKRK
jgi:hypothetical protein